MLDKHAYLKGFTGNGMYFPNFKADHFFDLSCDLNRHNLPEI